MGKVRGQDAIGRGTYRTEVANKVSTYLGMVQMWVVGYNKGSMPFWGVTATGSLAALGLDQTTWGRALLMYSRGLSAHRLQTDTTRVVATRAGICTEHVFRMPVHTSYIGTRRPPCGWELTRHTVGHCIATCYCDRFLFTAVYSTAAAAAAAVHHPFGFQEHG
ncbi:hypothetical protein B0T24DRAFT_34586 [Lasiosphaeria ovina]|uniref:Uncharacterized protein n=1 Tax=Lasiosphaeria ovina TaxID=92902 RepID=A0AAE0NKB1_9PEZI|nr:hypothetical protein B0T24DRAFT_34586 [Lasiosphaeria ovina]